MARIDREARPTLDLDGDVPEVVARRVDEADEGIDLERGVDRVQQAGVAQPAEMFGR